MEYNHFEIGKKIKEYRELKGISQAEFAKQAHITRAYLSKIEKGEGKSIGLDKLAIFADILEIGIDDLVFNNLIIYENSNAANPKYCDSNKFTQLFNLMTEKQLEKSIEFIKLFHDYKNSDSTEIK